MRAELATRLYSRTLLLYPRSLRDEFADEMTLVFEEQLTDANGAIDTVRIWLSVVNDLFAVALPARFAPVAVPALAIATALVWFIGVLGLIPLAHSR